MSTEALEARLRRVEDELEIGRLLTDYTSFLDGRDYDRYVTLFAADGEWTNHRGSWKGRAAIRAMLEEMVGPAGTPNETSYHLSSNARITLDGDRATAVSRFTFMVRGPDNKPVPLLAGIYRDEFLREDGQWKIARRAAQDIMPTPEQWAAMRAAPKPAP